MNEVFIKIARKIMIRRLGLMLVSYFVCTGCSNTTYLPKPGEQTAMVRFVTYSPDTSEVTVLDPAVCPKRKPVVYQFISGILTHSKLTKGSSGLTMLGSPDAESMDFIEFQIPASQNVLMTVGSHSKPLNAAGYECTVGVIFNAKANAQYEVQYRYQSPWCFTKVFELTTENSAVVRRTEPTFRQVKSRSYSSDVCAYR